MPSPTASTFTQGYNHGLEGMRSGGIMLKFEAEEHYTKDYCDGRRKGYKEYQVTQLLKGKTNEE